MAEVSKINKDDILEAVSHMSVMDIVDLVKSMEEKFGVTAAQPVAMVASSDDSDDAASQEVQTEFTVSMKSFGANKIAVIKTVRAMTGLGLKEAKDLVEGVPALIKEGINKEEADSMKKQLEEAGAEVEIK